MKSQSMCCDFYVSCSTCSTTTSLESHVFLKVNIENRHTKCPSPLLCIHIYNKSFATYRCEMYILHTTVGENHMIWLICIEAFCWCLSPLWIMIHLVFWPTCLLLPYQINFRFTIVTYNMQEVDMKICLPVCYWINVYKKMYSMYCIPNDG